MGFPRVAAELQQSTVCLLAQALSVKAPGSRDGHGHSKVMRKKFTVNGDCLFRGIGNRGDSACAQAR